MRLSLNENIKKFRKEMNLTQEELAEAFNVTVGAVSKWESGSTVPDIMTMMELADFFNISMDVLLRYDMSSKSIVDIAEKIKKLTNRHEFDEARFEADKALIRYPRSFKIIHQCAEMYSVLYTVSHEKNEEYRQKAIEHYEKALNFISQNDDPDISEFSIRMTIARLKGVDDPEGALEDFKKINYMGIADFDIAKALMNSGKLDEALSRYSRVILSIFLRSYELSTSMAIALACTDKRENYSEAINLVDWGIGIMDMTSDSSLGYFAKLKSVLIILKAMFLSCVKEYDQMEKCIDKAYELAKKFDEAPSNDLASKMKFWHEGDDYKPFAHDTLGIGAVEGIDVLFTQSPSFIQEKIVGKMDRAEKYWKKIYNSSK